MTKKMNIPFSPPDISEKEIEAVSEALRSGWITTGPRTKELDYAECIEKRQKDNNDKKDEYTIFTTRYIRKGN